MVLSVVAGPAELERDEVILSVPADADTVAIADIDDTDNEIAETSPTGSTVGITVRAGGATTYTLTDDADGRFTISTETGVVTVADGDKLDLDIEGSTTHHSITVEANNGSTIQFTIVVTEVNEFALTQVMDLRPHHQHAL